MKKEEEKSRENKDFPLVGWREIERGKENVGTGFFYWAYRLLPNYKEMR